MKAAVFNRHGGSDVFEMEDITLSNHSENEIVKGYHSIFPITDQERSILYILICIRLCTSVVMSAYNYTLEPDNEYKRINEQPAWTALYQLKEIAPEIAHYTFRQACQQPPSSQNTNVTSI